MQTKKIRSVGEVLSWTRRDILFLFCIASVPTFLYQGLGWKWLGIPWVPVALIGTAVSFIIGFKNNASYDRLWEARKIWGAIVNASRSFINSLIGFLDAEALSKEERQKIYLAIVRTHVAWLTALRFQLREPRSWEVIGDRDNARMKKKYYTIEEEGKNVAQELKPLLSEDIYGSVFKASNRAAQILVCQTQMLKELRRKGLIDRFQHIELQSSITEFYNQQGASERIKNFPYPRQFATLNLFYVRLFTLLLPFGMLAEFENLFGQHYVWLTIPFTMLVGWIFTTIEKVGETSENPFQGGANDIPITQISKNIEIDLMNLIEEPHNLQPLLEENGIVS